MAESADERRAGSPVRAYAGTGAGTGARAGRAAMSTFTALFLLAALWAAPAAAADAPPPPPLPAATPQPAVALVSPDEIVAVPPALMDALRTRVIAPSYSREQRLRRLLELIFDESGMHLVYDAGATNTIAETWQSHRANCLSFTLMFVTLANAAGIEARVQEVAQVVSWYQSEGVIYSVGHVNAGITMSGNSAVVDLDRNVLYDRAGPQPIPMRRALAHFYNNRGAQLMADGDHPAAREHFNAALQMSREFAPGWNNLGVLNTRMGELARARASYTTALQYQPRNAASLSNASALYRRLGEQRKAAQLSERLARIQRGDPFVQYMLATQAEQRHDYAQAIHHYRRALRLYNSAHQFHFGLARVYFLSGDNHRASIEMQRARDLAGADGDALKDQYQAKLDSLQRWRARSQPLN